MYMYVYIYIYIHLYILTGHRALRMSRIHATGRYTLNPQPCTLNPNACTLNPEP